MEACGKGVFLNTLLPFCNLVNSLFGLEFITHMSCALH